MPEAFSKASPRLMQVGLWRAEARKGSGPVEFRLDGVQTYRLVVDGTERGLMSVDPGAGGPDALGAEVRHRLEGSLEQAQAISIHTDAGEARCVSWMGALNASGSARPVWVRQEAEPGPAPTAALTVRASAQSGVDMAALTRRLRDLRRRWGGVRGVGFEMGEPHRGPTDEVWITPGGVPPDQAGSVCIVLHLGRAPRKPHFSRASLVADVQVPDAAGATAWVESLWMGVYADFLPLSGAVAHAHAWQSRSRAVRLRMAVPDAWHDLRVVRIPPWPGGEPWHRGWAGLYPGRWESNLPEDGRLVGLSGVLVVVGPSGSGRTSYVEAAVLAVLGRAGVGYTRVRDGADYTRFFQRLDDGRGQHVALLDDVETAGDPRLADWSHHLRKVGTRGLLIVVSTAVPAELDGLAEAATVRLSLPDRLDLLRVLRQPAEALGYAFEDGVLESIVDDAIASAPADRLREASERLRALWGRLDGFVFDAESVALAEGAVAGAGVASLASDQPLADGIHPRDQDQLAFWSHVEAFSSLILSRETSLPLSIGLFGDWGSGKSFLMRSLAASLDQRARQVRAAAPDPRDRDHWHGRVVSIHFNAWHFAGSDLWASLVHHLFRELGTWLADEAAGRIELSDEKRAELAEQERERVHLSMLQRLHTTRKRVKEAEAARASVRTRLEAEEARREGALRQGLLGVQHAASVFFADIKDHLHTPDGKKGPLSDAERNDVEAMAGLVGEADAVRTLLGERSPKNVDDVKQLVHDFSGFGWAMRYVSWLVRGPRPWARVGFMLGLLGVAYLFHNLVDFSRLHTTICSAPDGGPFYCGALAPTASTIMWLISTTATTGAMFRSWLKRTAPGLTKALSDPSAFDQRLKDFDALLPRFKADRAQAAAELARAESAVSAARQQLQDAEAAVQEAQSGRALHQFVQDGVGDRYRAHLGLMATINEDLDQLGSILEALEVDFEVARRRARGDAQVSADDIQPPPPPRIVLFIDDLDRCPPDRVVEVLEAVHLLLAKDLFAVVVAVDARWLLRSVDTHFQSLVEDGHDRSHRPTGDPRRVASARHYLEKIFQVPFQVPPMSDAGYARLVDRLVGALDAGDAAPQPAPTPAEAQVTAPLPPADEPAQAPAATVPGEAHATPPPADAPSSDPPPDAPPPMPAAEYVRFTALERDVLRALAPLVRTPRSTKRLVNTARLVRLHASEEPDWAVLCPVAFLLLGLEVGSPETWVAVRLDFQDHGFHDPLARMRAAAGAAHARGSGLSTTLTYLAERPGLSTDPRIWRRAMGLSERFAFLLDGGHTRLTDA